LARTSSSGGNVKTARDSRSSGCQVMLSSTTHLRLTARLIASQCTTCHRLSLVSSPKPLRQEISSHIGNPRMNAKACHVLCPRRASLQ
jgi:hypothetical protein